MSKITDKEVAAELDKISTAIMENGISKLSDMVNSLKEKVMPKPEFIKGEIVKHSDGGRIMLGEFIKLSESKVYPFGVNGSDWTRCEKIKKLPMHMTKFDGTNKPENDDDLVYIKTTYDNYTGGKVGGFTWDERVISFQLLRDLEQ